MKKVTLAATIGALALAGSAFAGQTDLDFDVRANLPEASGFKCDVQYQPAAGGNWAANPGGNLLDFGDLEEATDPGTGGGLGWFKSPFAQFFVCDLAPVNGVGIPTVAFSYADAANPNQAAGAPYNARGGLDKKGILTVNKVVSLSGGGQSESTLATSTFGQVASINNVTDDNVYGGWARLYFGLGFYDASGNVPANGEAFTGLDHYGVYEGTVTATVTW